LLRTVAANLSPFGHKRQNNDSIVIESAKRPERSSVLSMRDLPAAKLCGWREEVGSRPSFF